MTFKEFLKANPGEVAKAKSCKDIQEFKKLVDEHGITYENDTELKNAYNLVKNNFELSDDNLSEASGGKMYQFTGNIMRGADGKYYTTQSSGKKV